MAMTEQERLQYERAQRRYYEIQRRKSELSEKDKKLLEQIKAVELGNYDVTMETVFMIANVYQNNAINAFDTIFRLGFLKGMRKTKADMRKKTGLQRN